MNLPQGITLSEADFTKFMTVFGQIIDKAIEKKLGEYKRKDVAEILSTKKLTTQQIKIASGILAGQKIKEIAQDLGTTEKNVKQHTTNIYKKFGVGSKAQFLLLRG